MKLDVIDKKILAILLNCGRISIKELAETIGNNYPTIIKKVNKLVDTGVIRNFYPVLQLPGIGVRKYMSLYITLKTIPEEKKQLLVKEFVKNPFLIEISELEGKYNFNMLLVCNYIKEAHETINYIQRVCGEYLLELTAMQTYMISPLNRKFFMEEDLEIDYKKIITGYQPLINKTKLVHIGKQVKLNEEDIKLLNYLKLNAGDSFEEIKEKTGINSSVIDYKIQKYIQENLIKYFTIEIDHNKIGYYQYLLFLNMKGNEENKNKLIDDLYKNQKQAYHLFEYLNYWEIVVTYCVKDQSMMDEIIANLKKEYGDIQHQLLYIKKKYKSEPYPDVDKVYSKE